MDRLKKYYEIPHFIFDSLIFIESYLHFDNHHSNKVSKESIHQ